MTSFMQWFENALKRKLPVIRRISMSPIPQPTNVVLYCLTQDDADKINKRRNDSMESLDKHKANSDGTVLHFGGEVYSGERYPMLILRVWGDNPTENSDVNGLVFADGAEGYWVQGVCYGEGRGEFTWPLPQAMVGQYSDLRFYPGTHQLDPVITPTGGRVSEQTKTPGIISEHSQPGTLTRFPTKAPATGTAQVAIADKEGQGETLKMGETGSMTRYYGRH